MFINGILSSNEDSGFITLASDTQGTALTLYTDDEVYVGTFKIFL